MRLLPTLLLCTLAAAAQNAPGLDRKVRAVIGSFPGKVSLHARNLETGAAFSLAPDDPVRTASTIKLPVMAAVFDLVKQGKLGWSDETTLRETDKVSGSGILFEFSDGVRVPLRDLVNLMIVVSDNTATNLILDRIGGDAVNAFLDRLGLKRTRSLRKILGKDGPKGWSAAGRLEENKRFGIGVSTPREMAALMEKLERGEVVDADSSKQMLAILERQQYKDGIGRRAGDKVKVGSKSGSLDRLRSDVGIARSPRGRIVIAATVEDIPEVDYTPDNRGEILIADIAKILIAEL